MGSNGSKSGLYKGTKGNSQATIDNSTLEIANKIAEDQQRLGDKNTWPSGLTRNMEVSLTTGDNLIKDHCQAKDFSGTKIEANGGKISNGRGGYFNHIQEARDTIRGLDRVIARLNRSLENPKLDPKVSKFLRDKVSQYEYARNKLKDALEGK